MLDRKTLIANLDVGNIFHAEYPNGASCICLVLSVNDVTLRARRMTTQENLEFDRQTGVEKVNAGEAAAVINSVAPVPPEIHNVFLALDRKYGQMGPKEWKEPDLERFKLTEDEKNAFRFIDSYYAENPLPPPTS
jgi:hypothetical protein